LSTKKAADLSISGLLFTIANEQAIHGEHVVPFARL